MDDSSDEERRRLLAAAYGREGAGLDAVEKQRLTELLRSAHSPLADTHQRDDAGALAHPVETVALSTAATAQHPRRLLVSLLTIVGVAVVALAVGWVGRGWIPVPATDEAQIPVDAAVAATLDAARGEVANEADPNTLVNIGMLNGAVVWEARSADRDSRCFVLATIPDASQPAGADLLTCTPESAGAAELWSTSASGELYTARGTIQAVWGGQRPAQLEPMWQEVTVTPLAPSVIIDRTRAAPSEGEGTIATPVAVSGLTALWAVERDGPRCIYAITLSGSDVNVAGFESASSCREDGESPTWTFPGPDFNSPDAPPVRTVITWVPGEEPVASLLAE
ncbi:hypothetical protein [Microbacterium sp. ZW T5_56]|uniref:hypothetical protein n=1 Tax=Microbacterium sp. ZW T5_56 TaxID=3378081 RepID=UPI003852B8FC